MKTSFLFATFTAVVLTLQQPQTALGFAVTSPLSSVQATRVLPSQHVTKGSPSSSTLPATTTPLPPKIRYSSAAQRGSALAALPTAAASTGNAVVETAVIQTAGGMNANVPLLLLASGVIMGVVMLMKKAHAQTPAAVSKGQLLNDFTKVGLTAALIGGFARPTGLSMLTTGSAPMVNQIIWMLSFMCVHTCTFAAVASTVMYLALNRMSDRTAQLWVEKYPLVTKLPLFGFVTGCIFYISSVALSGLAYSSEFWVQFLYLLMGAICISLVWFVSYVSMDNNLEEEDKQDYGAAHSGGSYKKKQIEKF